ncbi:uncharacterized protein LOC123694762 [Colias croceus]|uniref:uncharacterized protein LOC123694762 n=1 Tax=Colias crocea TaxID=72248 RepID=UPI001E27C5EB|nr:uncharacterized protein LOC123694762 [Colias croceus]
MEKILFRRRIFLTRVLLLVLMVKGRNGKNLLMLNGYTYYQHKLLRDGFRWSCTQMGSRSCRGFLHVSADIPVVRAHIEHTHPPYATYSLHNVKKNLSNARKYNKLIYLN